MKQLSRKKIQDMIDLNGVNTSSRRSSGGSGGAGGGGVSSAWVDEHYVSKDFFARLFTINGTTTEGGVTTDVVVEPNDLDTDITDIQLMFGTWTEHYLSALGIGSGGGGGGGALLTEPLASINEAGMGTPSGANKVIAWNGNTWTYMPYTTGNGTVTSIRIAVPMGFSVNPSTAITTSGTFTISFARGTLGNGVVLATPSSGTGDPIWRALVADDIPSLSWAKITSGKPTTLLGYGINDAKIENGIITLGNATITPLTDAKLKSDYTWWGAAIDSTGKREGNMSNVGNISFSASGKNIGSVAYFDTTNHRLGIGSSPGAYKLDVNGDIRTSGNLYIGGTNRILSGSGDSAKNLLEFDGTQVTLAYGFRASNETRIYGQNISMYHGSTLKVQVTSTGLKIGDATLSWDSTNHALKIDTGFYSESFISALGAGSGGTSGGGMTEDQMWVALGTDGQTKQVALTHLTLALQNYAKTADVTKNLTVEKSDGTVLVEYNGTQNVTLTIPDGGFEMKSVTNATLKELSGTFGFYGYNLPDNDTRNYDWVGIQVGTTNDKWQLMADSGHLMVRQNDAGGSSSTGWVPVSSVESSGWYTVLDTGNYSSYALPKTGGMLTGALTISSGGLTLENGNAIVTGNITAAGKVTANQFVMTGGTASQFLKANGTIDSTSYLPLTGGTLSSADASISRAGRNGAWWDGRDYALLRLTSYNGYAPVISMKTTSGSWELSPHLSNFIYLNYVTDTDHTNQTNKATYSLKFPKKTDTIAVLSDIPSASNFVTLDTTQTITGNKSFTGNLSFGSGGKLTASNGATFQSVRIECDTNGAPANRTGEINRSDALGLCLQYDNNYNLNLCHGGGSVNIQDTLTFSKSGNDHTISASSSSSAMKLILSATEIYVSAATFTGNVSYTGSSDIRLKDVINPVTASVEDIANVRIFDFRWKKDGENGKILFGSAAQDWQPIFPHAVVADNEGFLSMDYGGIAVGAVKTVAQEVVLLKKRVAELEKQLKAS